MRRYNESDHVRVEQLYKSGASVCRISRETGIPRGTLFDWLHPECVHRRRQPDRKATSYTIIKKPVSSKCLWAGTRYYVSHLCDHYCLMDSQPQEACYTYKTPHGEVRYHAIVKDLLKTKANLKIIIALGMQLEKEMTAPQELELVKEI